MLIQTSSPLVLWGTDVMSLAGDWTFQSIGYNTRGAGVMTFWRLSARGKREQRDIPLVSWPVQR